MQALSRHLAANSQPKERQITRSFALLVIARNNHPRVIYQKPLSTVFSCNKRRLIIKNTPSSELPTFRCFTTTRTAATPTGTTQQLPTATNSSTNTTTAKNASEATSSHDVHILKLLQKGRLDKVVKVLEELFHLEKSSCIKLSTFHSILSNCSQSRHHNAGFQAEAFLAMMMEFYHLDRIVAVSHDDGDDGQKVTAMDEKAFDLCIGAWANSRHPQAGERAEQILHRMERLSQRGPLKQHVKPTILSYNATIGAYAKIGKPIEAQRILEALQQAYQNGNTDIRPNVQSWNMVLDAWSKSGDPKAGEQAHVILGRMIKHYKDNILLERPNAITYNTVMNCLAKTGQATKAERMLERMYHDYADRGNEAAKPNVRSFNIVIDGWANIQDGDRAEAILNRMLELHNSVGDEEFKPLQIRPDVVTYNSVINAYAKAGNVEHAERVMKRMYNDYQKGGNERAKPNVRSFTIVLGAWSKSGKANAGERAEAILDNMIRMHRDGKLDIKPTAFIYTAIINTWAELGNTQRAEAVFGRMLKDYQSGNVGARPTLPSIRAVLKAWYNSGASNTGEQADFVLVWMSNFHLNPDVSTLVSARRCWELHKKDDPKAQERIKEIQEQIFALEQT